MSLTTAVSDSPAPAWNAAVQRLRGPVAPIRGLPCGSPLLLARLIGELRRGRRTEEAEQLARVAKVGFDNGVRDGRDYGHSIRHARIVRAGVVLREPDVELVDGPDPIKSNRVIRRARRIDPLVALWRAGTIDGRSVDAAEALRDQLQGAEPSARIGGQSEIHVPAHQRMAISDRQLDQCMAARLALRAVHVTRRPVVLWVCLGGTLDAFALFMQCRRATVILQLSAGMTELADHYYRRTGGGRPT